MSAVALSSYRIPSKRSVNRSYRLTRTLVVLSLSVVIAGGYAMNAKAGSDSQANPEVQSYVTVVVAPGETLWSIASKFSDGDARSLVDQVITINSLSGGDVEAGQKIRIPLYK